MEIEAARSTDYDWLETELETDLSPMRKKCGMLPLKTLHRALDS
jgi:hypothetical protein